MCCSLDHTFGALILSLVEPVKMKTLNAGLVRNSPSRPIPLMFIFSLQKISELQSLLYYLVALMSVGAG